MRNSVSRIFWSIFLLGFSGMAFADSTNGTLAASAVTNKTDLSIAYLAQIFGTVNGSLSGTTGQMLGQLFYKLNQGILVVAGMWLAYTVLTMVLKSAQEGSFMGQNRNAALILMKIALGLGLLLPNPATGYSIFQDVVMKVVVEGVKLADATWDYGLNYVATGGSFWRPPSASTSSGAIIKGSNTGGIMKAAKQVFADEVCMYASNNVPTNFSQSHSAYYNSGEQGQNFHIVRVEGNNSSKYNNTFQFPGVGNNQTNVIDGKEQGHCGSFSWATFSGGAMSNCDSAYGSSQNSCQYAERSVSDMVYNLQPLAKSFYCSLNPAASGCSGVSVSVNHGGEAFFSSLVDYVNGVMPIAQSKQEARTSTYKSFISDAESEGWLIAGRYYWDLSKVQEHYERVSNIGNYVGSVNNEILAPNVNNASVNKAIDTANQMAGHWATSMGSSTGYIRTALQKLAMYQSANSKGGDQANSYKPHMAGMNWVVKILLAPVIGQLGAILTAFSKGPLGMGSDPILFLHNVGMRCLGLAGSIWLLLAGAIGLISIPAGICQSVMNVDTPIRGVTAWMRPPLMSLATLMVVIGVMLGFYVPLYPFMIFTFGIIGWLIAVIEAMVAAPLVCFGLTHPEGHDFLGQAQQALMLLLGVFLRPVLMVIGLIAGMILSYVSLRIIIYTYSSFMSDLFYVTKPLHDANASIGPLAGAALGFGNTFANSGGDGGFIFGMIGFPLFLAVFAGIVYVVTNQCFSLIYVLPDNILRWIGAPTSPSQSAQMAQQIGGQMSSGSNQMGQAGSQAASKKGKMKQKEQEKKSRHGNDDKKDDNKKGGGDIEMQDLSS